MLGCRNDSSERGYPAHVTKKLVFTSGRLTFPKHTERLEGLGMGRERQGRGETGMVKSSTAKANAENQRYEAVRSSNAGLRQSNRYGRDGQWLRAHTTVAKGLSVAPSNHFVWLTTACCSSCMGYHASSWPPQVPALTRACSPTHTYTPNLKTERERKRQDIPDLMLSGIDLIQKLVIPSRLPFACRRPLNARLRRNDSAWLPFK